MSASIKNIGYRLVRNATATADKAPYLGVAIPRGSLAYDNIVSQMLDSGLRMSRSTARYLLSALYEYAAEKMADDAVRLNLGAVSLYPAISGSFDSEDASFDPGRNTLYVGASFSRDVRLSAGETIPAYGGGEALSDIEINSVYEIASRTFGTIDGVKPFSISGVDLVVPDGEDESLALYTRDGLEKVCDITVSETDDGQYVKCVLSPVETVGKGAYKIRLASHGIDPSAKLAVVTRNVTLVGDAEPSAGPTITKFCTGGENGILRPAQFVNIEGDFDAADAENLPVATGAYQGATRTVQWSLAQLQVNTGGKMVAIYSTEPAFQFDDGATVTLHFRGATATATYNPQS